MAVIKNFMIFFLLVIFAVENIELKRTRSGDVLESASLKDVRIFGFWSEFVQTLKDIGGNIVSVFLKVLEYLKPEESPPDDQQTYTGDKEADEVRKSMFRGIGGTALISFYVVNNKRKQVIVRNGNATVCSVEAYVTKNKVFCGGTQTIAPYDNCRPGKKILKGHEGKLCLIDITGIIKSSQRAEEKPQKLTKCVDGVVLTREALLRQCGPNALSHTYATVIYVPDRKQPNFIQLPNPNPYVGCTNPDAKTCTFQVGISGLK